MLSPLINRVNLWAESKLGLKQKIKRACKPAPARAFGPHRPCIFRVSLKLEIESNRDKIDRLFPKSPDNKYVPYVIHKERMSSRLQHQSRRNATPNSRVSSK